MKLRTKTILMILGVSLISVGALYFILRSFLLKSFVSLENSEVDKEVQRTLGVLDSDIGTVNNVTGDWSNWDDAYNYIKKPVENKAFIDVNTTNTAFQQIKINLILFADNSGKIVFIKEVDLKNTVEATPSSWWQKNISAGSPILRKDPAKSISGIIILDDAPMLVSARPILTSNGDGPSAGTLIFSRYLDKDEISSISKRQKNRVDIRLYDDKNLPSDFFDAKGSLSDKNPIIVQALDEKTVEGYAVTKDIFDKPALILEEQIDRGVYQYGLSSITFFNYSFILYTAVFLFVILILLEWQISSRISRLSTELKEIDPKLGASARVGNYGKDEIGQLAFDLNNALSALESATRGKVLEASQKETILATMGQGVVVTDTQGKIGYVNSAFQDFLGFSKDDLAGRVFSEAIVAYDLRGTLLPSSFLDDQKAFVAKGSDIKVIILGKEEKKAAIINTAPITVNGKLAGVVRVFHDYAQDLEFQRQKDDFFSIASHELRTPMTVVAGNLDNILQGYGGSKLTEADLNSLKDSMLATERLIKLVNDFLNVSRIDQGRVKLDIKPMDLCALTEKVVNDLIPMATKKGLALTFVCDRKHGNVMGDTDKITEAIINLIGNSLKFTTQGGITVSHVVKDGLVETQVTDTGMGIPKEKQGLLFKRFSQVSSRTIQQSVGGTGLGLYISREFTKLMGGDMWLAKSEPGKGSTFAFSLPLAKEVASQTPIASV